jgi:hypothetical protein
MSLYIPLYKSDIDWHCPDASDKIGLFRISELSEHNIQLVYPSDLLNIKYYLAAFSNDSDKVPFVRFCNYIKEYGCILNNVGDPLNFTINRPCINLTQIGDGVIDCSGGLDERNLLSCGDNLYEQRGYDFHCSDQECIPYHRLCDQRCSNNADSVLCDQLPTLWNLFCPYPTRKDICQPLPDKECDLFEISKYYCDMGRLGK